MYLQQDDFICPSLNENYMDLVNKLNNLGIKESFHTEKFYEVKEDLFYKLKLLYPCIANVSNILKKNIDFIKIANVKDKQEYVTNLDNLESYFMMCHTTNHLFTISEFLDLLSFISSESKIASQKILNNFNITKEDDTIRLTNEDLKAIVVKKSIMDYNKQISIILDVVKTLSDYSYAYDDFCKLFRKELSSIVNDDDVSILYDDL